LSQRISVFILEAIPIWSIIYIDKFALRPRDLQLTKPSRTVSIQRAVDSFFLPFLAKLLLFGEYQSLPGFTLILSQFQIDQGLLQRILLFPLLECVHQRLFLAAFQIKTSLTCRLTHINLSFFNKVTNTSQTCHPRLCILMSQLPNDKSD
jgi:hypothetical protein